MIHERRAGGLVVAAAGVVHRPAVAAAGNGADVQAAPHLGSDGRAQRVPDERVLEPLAAVRPGGHVGGSEAPLEALEGRRQRTPQHVVASRERVVAEAAVGGGQPVDHPLDVDASHVVPSRDRDHRAVHGGAQLALPAHVDRRLHRVPVEHAVPGQQHPPGPVAARAQVGDPRSSGTRLRAATDSSSIMSCMLSTTVMCRALASTPRPAPRASGRPRCSAAPPSAGSAWGRPATCSCSRCRSSPWVD